MAEHGSPADLVKHLSNELPMTTICEVLDIPEEDRQELRRCAIAMMAIGSTTKEAAIAAKAHLRSYFQELTVARRADPGDDSSATWPPPGTAARSSTRRNSPSWPWS